MLKYLTLYKLNNIINIGRPPVVENIFKKEMEGNNPQEGEGHPGLPVAQSEALSLDLIRTETVLSRLPVHNLAKQGRVNIQIIKTTTTGEVELKWEVSYSERYGQARQLAYKLDTIIINQRIDEAGRPLPKLLRIGSLNEICAELNLATHAGQNTKDLKRAFLQNASAFITAKFDYRANDGTERHVEAGVTRYGVIFTGEKLPDGRKADAVYITFNDPFWEVLNNAPVRPLDRTYMKELPPAAQRFYEIISRKIFAALKNHYARAKIAYSEYCTFSAQLRHFERQRVQDQMAKVLRPHKASGYITSVKYEPIIDAQSRPDWMIYLTPGPKAHAEFAAAHTRRRIAKPSDPRIESGDEGAKSYSHRRNATTEPSPVQPNFDPALVSEFTRRGITEKKAYELLTNLRPGQDIIARLEYYDHMIEHAGFRIVNPPGFYIRLIEGNLPIPDGFETKAQRKAREEREANERAERLRKEARQDLEDEYERYCFDQTDRYIADHPDIFDAIKAAKLAEEERFSAGTWIGRRDNIALAAAKWEIRKQVTLLTFDEFLEQKKQGTDFSLKPVAPSPAAELEAEPEIPGDLLAADERRQAASNAEVSPKAEESIAMAGEAAPETRMSEPIAVTPNESANGEEELGGETEDQSDPPVEMGHDASPAAEDQPDVSPQTVQPMMIELVSDPPQEEASGGEPVGEAA